MVRNRKKENEEKFNEAALKAGKLFDNQKGEVEVKDLQEIADEFEVDVEELFAETKYDYNVWQAVQKADKVVETIADEFEIDWDDFEIGLTTYWEGCRESFQLAVEKSLQLIEDKKGEITIEEIQEIAAEFGVTDIEALKEAIVEVINYNKQENE
jgi:Ca2+-binding EF-hand superfamily protein